MAADERGLSSPNLNDTLKEIQSTLRSIQQDYRGLTNTLEAIEGRVNVIAGLKEVGTATTDPQSTNAAQSMPLNADKLNTAPSSIVGYVSAHDTTEEHKISTAVRGSGNPSRIILTTYPGQVGIDPINMDWGQQDPILRGPVVVSRSQSTIKRRNGMKSVIFCSFNPNAISCFGRHIRFYRSETTCMLGKLLPPSRKLVLGNETPQYLFTHSLP